MSPMRNLDRDEPAQLRVARFPDDAERSGANLLQQLESSKFLTLVDDGSRTFLLEAKFTSATGANDGRGAVGRHLHRTLTVRASLHCHGAPPPSLRRFAPLFRVGARESTHLWSV